MSDYDANTDAGAGAPAAPPVTDVPMKRDRARLRRPETTPSTPPPVAPPAADAAPVKPVNVPPAITPAVLAQPHNPAPAYPHDPPVAIPPRLPSSQPEAPETATALFAALQPDVTEIAPDLPGPSKAQPDEGVPPTAAGYSPVIDTSMGEAHVESADNPALPGIGLLQPTPTPELPGLRGLEITAFIAAILLPPLGLILAIIARGRAKTSRGWVSDLVRYAIPIAVVLTILLAGAIAVWFFMQGRTDASAEVALMTSSLFPASWGL